MRSLTATVPEITAVVVLGLFLALAMPGAFQPSGSAETVSIRNLAPADGTRIPARPYKLSAEVIGERDLHNVRLLVNDAAVEPQIERVTARQWRIQANIGQPTGEQRLQLVVRDRHGRQRISSARLLVDTALSAPIISDIQPPPGGYAPASEARFNAVVQSDVPLETATLQVGNQKLPVTMQPPGGTKVTATAKLSLTPGTYDAVFTAVDREGDTTTRRWRFDVPDPKELLAFEQTGKAISSGFRTYWLERGGLAIFGLPISNEMREGEGNLTVQYFERARFEYHPRDGGLLSEVRLGLIGTELRKPDPPRSPTSAPDSVHFNETGHAIAGPIRRFWESNGGVAIFGLPITDETREGPLTVQYFERARLELHATSSGQTVLIGLIGREIYERRYPSPTPATSSG